MKQIYIFLCAFAITLSSCGTSTEDKTTDGSTLDVPAGTVILSKSDSVKTVDLKLSCGCGFTLAVASITGDTNTIKFIPLEKMDESLSKHSIQFFYSPSSPNVIPQTVTLNFMAKKKTYTYTNKVSVQIN